jgi:hypothetical protein
VQQFRCVYDASFPKHCFRFLNIHLRFILRKHWLRCREHMGKRRFILLGWTAYHLLKCIHFGFSTVRVIGLHGTFLEPVNTYSCSLGRQALIVYQQDNNDWESDCPKGEALPSTSQLGQRGRKEEQVLRQCIHKEGHTLLVHSWQTRVSRGRESRRAQGRGRNLSCGL